MNLVLSPQRPRRPYSRELLNGARACTEVRGGKDVSHRPGWQYAWLIPRCSWSAIFLYVYTGQIKFAALDSQDVTLSETEVQDSCSQGERMPPEVLEGLSAVVVEPCSPKSVYGLANKVCLPPLRIDAVTNSSFV